MFLPQVPAQISRLLHSSVRHSFGGLKFVSFVPRISAEKCPKTFIKSLLSFLRAALETALAQPTLRERKPSQLTQRRSERLAAIESFQF